MRLPYVQIAMEVIELSAPELAVLLECEESLVGWGLAKLIPWALARCPDDAPPSANDVVRGPAAAKLIARAAGYPGDPEAFVTACEQLAYPVLERVADGIRIRGLRRYDAAWGKSNAEAWKAWKAAHPEYGTEGEQASARPVSDSSRNRPESGATSGLQMQTQIQTQKQEKKKPQPPAAEAAAPEPDSQISKFANSAPKRDQVAEMQGVWNELAPPPLPRWRESPKARRAAASERLRERPIEGPTGWREVIARIARSRFCLGSNARGWKADVDFLLRPDTATKVLEGKYDDAEGSAQQLPLAERPRCAVLGCAEPPGGQVWGHALCYPHFGETQDLPAAQLSTDGIARWVAEQGRGAA